MTFGVCEGGGGGGEEGGGGEGYEANKNFIVRKFFF